MVAKTESKERKSPVRRTDQEREAALLAELAKVRGKKAEKRKKRQAELFARREVLVKREQTVAAEITKIDEELATIAHENQLADVDGEEG